MIYYKYYYLADGSIQSDLQWIQIQYQTHQPWALRNTERSGEFLKWITN